MSETCPRCGSPDPQKHPAVQADGGEVQVCPHQWHKLASFSPVTTLGTDVEKWADQAMYRAEEMPRTASGKVEPRVSLLSMTPDPLGTIAAACGMYEGRVMRSLGDVTHEDRQRYLREMQKTKLKAPLEFVQFHFLMEGVTRSFTHQLVRQRTATYTQESLRFAVKEHIDEEVALPPSLRSLPDDDPKLRVWKRGVNAVDDAYHALVSAGVPAEDARGLLPHALTTRVHYSTDLRALLDHAGNRLCTQAQFEWREVFTKIAYAIRHYDPTSAWFMTTESSRHEYARVLKTIADSEAWQYAALAELLRPVCYQVGECVFNADFDRACSIRERVQKNAALRRPSDLWATPVYQQDGSGDAVVAAIQPREWLLDPGAAR